MIKPKLIRFCKAEGRINDGITGKWFEFTNFKDVNHFIYSLERTELGCYKCDYSVEFDDGFIYNGHYELDNDPEFLNFHIRRNWIFYSGNKPNHFTEEQFQNYLKFCEVDTAFFKNLRENYSLD